MVGLVIALWIVASPPAWAVLGMGGYGGVSAGVAMRRQQAPQLSLGIGDGAACWYVVGCARTTLLKFSGRRSTHYHSNLRQSKAALGGVFDPSAIAPSEQPGGWSFLNIGIGPELGYYGLLVVPHYMVDWWSTSGIHARHIVGLDVGFNYYFSSWVQFAWEKEKEYSAFTLRLGVGAGYIAPY